jgi:SAM-dependent methyltransferase
MPDVAQFNADQVAYWSGAGGDTWVARQQHTDVTLAPLYKALLGFAAPRNGEQVLDIGCGCGATTLEFARAVGPSGQVAALDISPQMLAEAKRRAEAAGITNIDWRLADAATATLDGYDLLTSAIGVMFFGDPIAAFSHIRGAAKPGARMALVTWAPPAENPWMAMPMQVAAPHFPPQPEPDPQAPGMFAFANPQRVTEILTAAGWAAPRFQRLNFELDLAAGRGLDGAVEQSTQMGAISRLLRGQPPEVAAQVSATIRKALEPYVDGSTVRFPAAAWLVSSAPA